MELCTKATEKRRSGTDESKEANTSEPRWPEYRRGAPRRPCAVRLARGPVLTSTPSPQTTRELRRSHPPRAPPWRDCARTPVATCERFSIRLRVPRWTGGRTCKLLRTRQRRRPDERAAPHPLDAAALSTGFCHTTRRLPQHLSTVGHRPTEGSLGCAPSSASGASTRR